MNKNEGRVAGQFEKLSTIYISLVDFNFISPSKIEKYTNLPTLWNVEAFLLREISPYVRPVVLVNSKEELKKFIKSENLEDLKIYYYIIKHDDAWIRDTGCEWLITENSQSIIDHNFGLWGYISIDIKGDWKFCDQPNEIPKNLSSILNQNFIPMPDWYKGEGGNRSFNGKGSLICNLTCELQRNPTKSQKELEDLFKDTFNISKVIWIPLGVSDDDLSFLGPKYFEENTGIPGYTSIGTGGHVDEFCRFINPTTIVLCGVGDLSKYNYKPGFLTLESESRMNLVYDILRHQTDQDGNKFTIIRIPFPECEPVLIDKEDVTHDTLSQLYDTFPEKVYAIPASSYGNFILCNEAVVVSQYSIGCKDESLKKKLEYTDNLVFETFSKYFKKVIRINNLQQNFGGGGLNCTSCDQPSEGLKELPGILYKE
jgi:agmatine deiminase